MGEVVHVTDVPAAATLIGLTFPVQPSPLLLRNNSVRYPHQKAQGVSQAKFIEEAYSKREPAQNPKLRYFKPFEFFEHTGSPTAQSPTDARSSFIGVAFLTMEQRRRSKTAKWQERYWDGAPAPRQLNK